jgi:predicted Ser/Thr protein kinase
MEIRRELGHGAFGVVFLAMWEGSPVALKRLTAFDLENFEAEVHVMM